MRHGRRAAVIACLEDLRPGDLLTFAPGRVTHHLGFLAPGPSCVNHTVAGGQDGANWMNHPAYGAILHSLKPSGVPQQLVPLARPIRVNNRARLLTDWFAYGLRVRR